MTVKKFQEYVSRFVHLYPILSIGGVPMEFRPTNKRTNRQLGLCPKLAHRFMVSFFEFNRIPTDLAFGSFLIFPQNSIERTHFPFMQTAFP